MSQVRTENIQPSSGLYQPFESKAALMVCIRDSLVGADQSRLQDVLHRLSATDSCIWPDSRAVATG